MDVKYTSRRSSADCASTGTCGARHDRRPVPEVADVSAHRIVASQTSASVIRRVKYAFRPSRVSRASS